MADGYIKTLSKICGLRLDGTNNIESDDFEELLRKAINLEDDSIKVNQVRKTVSKDTGLIELKEMAFHIRNTLCKKRVVLKNLKTLPFGYTKEMLEES